jgi:hypothetical protein
MYRSERDRHHDREVRNTKYVLILVKLQEDFKVCVINSATLSWWRSSKPDGLSVPCQTSVTALDED